MKLVERRSIEPVPVAERHGEADLAWIVGLVVAAFLYIVLMRPVVNGR